MQTCSIPTCDRIATHKAMCKTHYERWLKHGDPSAHIPITKRAPRHYSPEQRFWSKVDQSDGPDACWPWMGSKNKDGYGNFGFSKEKNIKAHRMAYLLTHGDIPQELEIDHRCHTKDCTLGNNCPHRRCCNPAHLKAVTHQENSRRGNNGFVVQKLWFLASRMAAASQRARTHCKHGHLFDEANTYIDRNGHRSCKTCRRVINRKFVNSKRHNDTNPK